MPTPAAVKIPVALGWQIVLHVSDRRALAPSAARRRALARVLARLGDAFGVYAWCAADNHLHVAAFCTHEQARELARRLQIALLRSLELDVSFERPRLTAINDAAHARSVLTYIIGQATHHCARQDDVHEGNCIHDLVGARVIAPWLPVRVREHFPRVTRAQLLAPLGLEGFVDQGGLDAEATAAAFALGSLGGRSDEVLAARRATIAVATTYTQVAIGAALGVDERTVRRLTRGEPPAAHVVALRRQIGLRTALLSRPGSLVVSDRAAPAYRN